MIKQPVFKRKSVILQLVPFLIFFSIYGPSNAKEKVIPPDDIISVFLDFSYYTQFIRENITFVNYVRDRELAQVHIMVNRQQSASAGTTFEISFIGRGRFENMNNKLNYWAPGTHTEDEIRRGFADMIRMGLVPYLASTSMMKHLSLSINNNVPVEREPVKDDWNQWVFELYGGANYFKESKQSRSDSRWGFYADKVSDEWKIRLRPYFNLNDRKFKTDNGTILRKSYRHGFEGYMIKSINQHWSAGLFLNMLSSTFHNIRFNSEVSSGVEYSLFPYRESNRRAVTVVYRVGVGQHKYLEKTIYLKEQETLANHALNVSIRYQQPWGSFRTNITASNYFHDFDVNRLEFNSQLNLRLYKGLSLNLNGRFDFINDLVALPAGKMSLEDILLQQRRQATDYQISTSIGLSYRFGSQFTNVVNTRF